jgi:hypothetical protein
MPDSPPKLRVIDENPAESGDVFRLGKDGIPAERVRRLPGPAPAEAPERLESETRERFDGRSLEPGVEAILDKPEPVANIEQPWGVKDDRMTGIPYGWFVLIFLVLAGAGLWSLGAMRQGEIKQEVQHGAVRDKVAREAAANLEASRLVERVEQVVAAYLAADEIEEILPWVRQPERVRPLIEETWKSQPKKPLKFSRMILFQASNVGTRPFWVVQAEVEEGDLQNLLVEQTGDAEVKIDWETHVCHQPMAWDRYVAERPGGQALDFRVTAVPDTFFNHEFSDDGSWRCFRLMAKDSDEFLFGYAKAGGEVADELDRLGRDAPGRIATAVLRLRALPESNTARGVVIEKVVSPRWLLLDEPPRDAP